MQSKTTEITEIRFQTLLQQDLSVTRWTIVTARGVPSRAISSECSTRNIPKSAAFAMCYKLGGFLRKQKLTRAHQKRERGRLYPSPRVRLESLLPQCMLTKKVFLVKIWLVGHNHGVLWRVKSIVWVWLSKQRVNRVWLSCEFYPLSPFTPEGLVSRVRFDCPVPHHPAYFPYWGWIWCLLNPWATGFQILYWIYYAKIGSSSERVNETLFLPLQQKQLIRCHKVRYR